MRAEGLGRDLTPEEVARLPHPARKRLEAEQRQREWQELRAERADRWARQAAIEAGRKPPRRRCRKGCGRVARLGGTLCYRCRA